MFFSPLKQVLRQVKDIIDLHQTKTGQARQLQIMGQLLQQSLCLNPKMSLFLNENSLIHQCNSSNFFKTIS